MRILWAFFFSALFCTSASALTEYEIQGYIDEAIKAGGGEVVIPPGTHLIKKGLVLKDAKKIRLVGLDAERCILKLRPLAFAKIGIHTSRGAVRLTASGLQNIIPGMRLRIEAPGEIDPFTQKPKSYFLAFAKSIEGSIIELREPLKFPVPAGTLVRHEDAPSAIEVRGASENVTLEKLCIDGGRISSDPLIRGHDQLCGVKIAGPYTFEKGPTGPRVKNVKMLRCIIQNCHGRGAAFFSAESGGLEDCTFMDISNAAVDLGHFSENVSVRHNNVARCLVGVDLNDAKGCLVTANEILRCDTGIQLWRGCKLPDWNAGNQIINNQIDQTRGTAIQLGLDTSWNLVTENVITKCGGYGILVQGENQNVEINSITGSALTSILRIQSED